MIDLANLIDSLDGLGIKLALDENNNIRLRDRHRRLTEELRQSIT